MNDYTYSNILHDIVKNDRRMWNGNIYYFLGHLQKNEEDILVADCRPR